jgi:hypothetical protein
MKTLILCLLALMSFKAAANCGDLGLASQTANCMQNERGQRSNQHYQQFNQSQCSDLGLASQVANCMQNERDNQEQIQRQQEYQEQKIQQQEQPEQWRRHKYKDKY